MPLRHVPDASPCATGNGATARVLARRASRVEYVYYGFVVIALFGVCMYMVRRPTEGRLKSGQADLAERARRRRQTTAPTGVNAAQAARRQQSLNRDLRTVPTPWGWPGSEVRAGSGLNGAASGQDANGAQRPLPQWIDRLISEKRTVDDRQYLLSRDAALRAMLEDRFGRPVRPTEIAYQPVRAPQLRDPNRPYDQMDNFPGGQTDRIVAKLQRQPGTSAQVRKPAAARGNVPLRDIKTPWGW